jgi:threonine/homoserine/homoserine lactone efflux protein
MAASAQAFRAVQLAGAAYLVFQGIRGWRAVSFPAGGHERPGCGPDPGFRTGLLSNVLNPKARLFFAAVSWISDRARALLRRPRIRAVLDRAAGATLLVLGVKVAAGQLT